MTVSRRRIFAGSPALRSGYRGKVAHPAMAQSSALKKPVTERAETGYSLLRKVAEGWDASRCWIRYLWVGARNGVPGLVDFVLGNHCFTARQVAGELTALGETLATLRPKCALEIGTFRGGTLLFLCRLASPQATIVSVDLPRGRFGGGYGSTRAWLYKRFALRRQQLQLLQGDSHSNEMLARVRAVLGAQELDYLFIDGDHTYGGVKRDFELYAPLVRKGGLIALHDIAEHPPTAGCEVSRFWNEIKCRYRHLEMIENRQQGRAGMGVLYVD